jgi:hypothetical protein
MLSEYWRMALILIIDNRARRALRAVQQYGDSLFSLGDYRSTVKVFVDWA